MLAPVGYRYWRSARRVEAQRRGGQTLPADT
jgi:hypothetical protein